MSDDAGKSAPTSAGAPDGVADARVSRSGRHGSVAPQPDGFVYLFHSDTLTGGGAGTTGVQYTFT